MILPFIIENPDDAANTWITQFIYRLNLPANLKNKPFETARLSKQADNFYLLELTPLWPRFSAYGLIFGLAVYLFGFYKWLYLPAGLMVLIEVFWQPRFYFWVMKLAFKINKSKAKVKYVSQREALKRLAFNGTD